MSVLQECATTSLCMAADGGRPLNGADVLRGFDVLRRTLAQREADTDGSFVGFSSLVLDGAALGTAPVVVLSAEVVDRASGSHRALYTAVTEAGATIATGRGLTLHTRNGVA